MKPYTYGQALASETDDELEGSAGSLVLLADAGRGEAFGHLRFGF